jgi:hypothetical protein
MNLLRRIAFTGLFVSTLGAAPASAQQTLGGHDGTTIPIVLGNFFPSTPVIVAAMSPVCIVLEEGERSLVYRVMEGTASPVLLEDILSQGGARTEAATLSRELVGLLTSPRTGQATSAVSLFNALVLRSSEAFLRAPPTEFLDVHRVMEHASSRAPVLDEWACFVPEPPPPVMERLIEVCLLLGNDLRMVTAVYRPESGDTMLDGVPLHLAHPPTMPGYGAGAAWFVQEDSLTFNDAVWIKFGVTRAIDPDDVRPVGFHQGTPLFAESAEQPPYPVLYVPVRPGCEVQPYRPREELRPRGG